MLSPLVYAMGILKVLHVIYISVQDISILIPDFYDILELEENSEAASHHSGLDNPNLLPDDNKGQLQGLYTLTYKQDNYSEVFFAINTFAIN